LPPAKKTRPKPGRSREWKLALGLLLIRLLILVTLLATLTGLLLARLLTGLLLSTTALLATLSRLLVLLRAALSALILISHVYCTPAGDYSHQDNTDGESKFRG
jgi:hypothetical protein